MHISIVYWSGTGNTKSMAEAVAKGAGTEGAKVKLMEVSAADAKSRMKAPGAVLIGGEGIIANEVPDDETLLKLEEAGRELAQLA